jgi:cob(I)alamin adenosyltransferase
MIICGLIDQCVSVLGVAFTRVKEEAWKVGSSETLAQLGEIANDITYIQKKFFDVASEIATLEPKLSKLPNRIDEKILAELDLKCLAMEYCTPLPKGFVLPGHSFNRFSCYLDLARTTCRQIEAPLVDLFNSGKIGSKWELTNTILLKYINRLSDYIYLLARYSENEDYRMVK